MFTWLIYVCNVHRWNLPYRNNIYQIWVSGVKKLWKGDWDLNGGKPSESIARCSINQAIWCQHFNQTCTVSMNKTYFFYKGKSLYNFYYLIDTLTISCGPPSKQDVQRDQDGSYRIQVHQLRHLVLLVHTLGTWSISKGKTLYYHYH